MPKEALHSTPSRGRKTRCPSPLVLPCSLTSRCAPIISTANCAGVFPACVVRLWARHVIPVPTTSSSVPLLSWFLAPIITIALLHLLLPFQLFRITPEEGVHHHIPLLRTRQGTTQVLDLARQQP